MKHIQLHALTPNGPCALPLPAESRNIHELFDDLPVGVYTSLRTFEHDKFLHLDDHLDRLQQSAILLGWDYQLDRSRLRRGLRQVCQAYSGADARVRLDILARPVSCSNHRCRELIGLFPLTPVPEALYRYGVKVSITRQLVRDQPRAKQAQFARQRRRFLEHDSGAYELMMVDQNGFILEGTTSNFYAVKDGVLYTAGAGVLEGIARKIVLMMADGLGIPVRLAPVHVDDISLIDECALSSSSRAIVPIVNIAGQIVGDGRPGPVVCRLLASYNDYVAGAIRPAIE